MILTEQKREHWNGKQGVQRQYMTMYMRRRKSLASIGSEDEDRENEESEILLINAIGQVKEFAQIMRSFNL